MSDLIIKAPATPLFYVTIDGTDAIDSVAIGTLWQQQFGWKNLLFDWQASKSDAHRRVDNAHPTLPIKFVSRRQSASTGGNTFADICIMPEGPDGKGVDPGNWPSSDPGKNVAQLSDANAFIQDFVLSPRCAPGSPTQQLGTGSRVADMVYISSHGVVSGDMFGTASNEIEAVLPFFILTRAAASGKSFDGVKWLILSNCNTLVTGTHNDWLTLMKASTQFRGILGYHGTSKEADTSSGADVSFAKQLKAGKSMRDAWRAANKRWGMTDRWVVMCHDAAKDDDIQAWNAGTLAPVSFTPPSVLLFDEANLSGTPVVPTKDPFTVSWSKTIAGASVPITPKNRYDKGNKVFDRDELGITVSSPPLAATFAPGTTVSITLVLVRENYPVPIDVSTMFTITSTSGVEPAVTFSGVAPKKNTWNLTVRSSPAPGPSISMTLQIVAFAFADHHNLPMWLQVTLTPPSGAGAKVGPFDFDHDATIYIA
jgi:hypothetical protein